MVIFSSQDLKELSGLVTEFSLLVHVSTNTHTCTSWLHTSHFLALYVLLYPHVCTATRMNKDNVTEVLFLQRFQEAVCI